MFSKPLTSISAGSSCRASSSMPSRSLTAVPILGARQALHRHMTGDGASRAADGAIELRLHPRHERVDLALIRLAASGRRHQPAAQLAHGGFPDVGVLLNRIVQGQGVERHASGMDRRAVAPDAVRVERLARLLGAGRSCPTCASAAVVRAATTTPIQMARFIGLTRDDSPWEGRSIQLSVDLARHELQLAVALDLQDQLAVGCRHRPGARAGRRGSSR